MSPILYLHGFASGPNSTKAGRFRECLAAAGAQVEVPDLAAGDFEHLTLTGQLAVIEHLAAGRPVALIGSSLGGYLAALYAARHPEVPRLVLLAPAFDFARRWADHLGSRQVEAWRRTGTIDVFHYSEGRTCRLSYDLLTDAARYEPFPDVRQPALIFHGSRDDVVPAALSRQFAATHPDARLEIVDSGHELVDVVETLAARARDFLL